MVGVAHVGRREDDFAFSGSVLVPRALRGNIARLFVLCVRRVPTVKVTSLIIHVKTVKGITFDIQHFSIYSFQVVPDLVGIGIVFDFPRQHFCKNLKRVFIICKDVIKIVTSVSGFFYEVFVNCVRFVNTDKKYPCNIDDDKYGSKK